MRKDYSPSKKQIERGLTDKYEGVREAFAKRIDVTLTPTQVERGLLDESS
jgi:hypothetical protein